MGVFYVFTYKKCEILVTVSLLIVNNFYFREGSNN